MGDINIKVDSPSILSIYRFSKVFFLGRKLDTNNLNYIYNSVLQ